MTAIAAVHNGEGGFLLGQNPDLLQRLSQRMTIIGIARQGAHPTTKPSSMVVVTLEHV